MKLEIVISEMKPSELYFLPEMFYDAIFVPEGDPALPTEIIYQKDLAHYIRDFGRKDGDFCLVARHGNYLAGAVWCRLFPAAEPGYGFVDEATPELSMAVRRMYRSQGVGAELLSAMLVFLGELGFAQVSLSVDMRNPALGMYERAGFRTVKTDKNSATMVKTLDPAK